MSVQRADARRNHARLLAVAEAEVAAYGADASLEQIARVAGVGSATVRRHFPSRRALLEAVFRERIEALCANARDLAGRSDTRAALLEWLRAVAGSAATIRGLATALARYAVADPDAAKRDCGTAQLAEAGGPLVRRAVDAGTVAPGVTVTDLLTLITGIAMAAEHHPDPAAETDRLLRLVVVGVCPHREDGSTTSNGPTSVGQTAGNESR